MTQRYQVFMEVLEQGRWIPYMMWADAGDTIPWIHRNAHWQFAYEY